VKGLLAILAVSLLTLPAVVEAKKSAGYQIPNWEERPDEMAWLVARCNASVNRSEARRVFAHIPYSAEGTDAMYEAIASACHRSSTRNWTLTMEPSIVRGGMAEELLEIDFRGVMTRSVRRPQPVFDAVPEEEFVQLSAASRQALLLIEFGQCVTARNTQAVAEYLDTDLLSDEEGAILEAMSGDFAACMFEGSNVQFTRPSMRAFIAEGAYRATVASDLARRQTRESATRETEQ
jgi:hypothetical protein